MFQRMVQMDWRRCFRPLKIMVLLLAIVLFFLVSSQNYIHTQLYYHSSREDGAYLISMLNVMLMISEYQVLMTLLLSAIYTVSFCSDENTQYLRFILSRVDITTYTQSRFLVNTFVITGTAILSIFVYVIILLPMFVVWNPEEAYNQFYYQAVIDVNPYLYLLMVGLQFGLIISACSSIGLLFSVYQSNAFVTICVSGITFFCWSSYVPDWYPISISPAICMQPTFQNFPHWFNYIWGLLLPILVIVVCGYLFYRRMKWRLNHGLI